MKRIGLWMLMLVIGISLGKAQTNQQAKKVAILEVVDRDNAVNYGVKLLLRTTLAKAITQTSGYEGYDRVDMGAIQGEQDFQRTGMVSDAEIKKLGEMTGAAYVLVAEAAKLDETLIIVTAKILDVETAKLEKTDYEQMSVNAKAMAEGCKKLANRLLRISPEMAENTQLNDSNKEKSEPVQTEKTQPKESKRETPPASFTPSGEIIYKGGRFCEVDSYGFARPIGRTNTKLYLGDWYKDYQKAKTTQGFGIFFMSAGGGAVVAGISLLMCYFIKEEGEYHAGEHWYYDYYESSDRRCESRPHYCRDVYPYETFIAGVTVASFGVVLMATGAPMYAIPNKKLKRILEIVQEQNLTQPYRTACTFDFNTQYGIGFALHF